MANEIQTGRHTSGKVLYAVIISATGTVYNGATLEAFNEANWATYEVALTEQGSTGHYFGTFPALAAGLYTVHVYDKPSGVALTSDEWLGSDTMDWNGTAEVGASSAGATVLDGVNSVDTGITVRQSLTALIAWAFGEAQIPTDGTIEYLRRDGATVAITVTRGSSLGERDESTLGTL